MKDTTQLLESLIDESTNSVLSVRLDSVGDAIEAQAVQLLWQAQCPGLDFDIETKSGVWYLLISKRNQLRVVVCYDN